MKSKLAAAIVIAALALTGCGATTEPTSSASSTASTPAASTLTAWVNDIGLLAVISDVANGLADDLKSLSNTDVKAANAAFAARAQALAPYVESLKAEPASATAEFEQLRARAQEALSAYAAACAALGSAKAANRAELASATATAMSGLTASIQALVDYITAHGSDSIQAAY